LNAIFYIIWTSTLLQTCDFLFIVERKMIHSEEYIGCSFPYNDNEWWLKM